MKNHYYSTKWIACLLYISFFLHFTSRAQVVIETQKATASDREANENFGNNVAISGNYAIVGATNEGTLSTGGKTSEGAAYIYERGADGSWKETQKLVAQDRGNDDHFGNAVAISGKYAFIGSKGNQLNEIGGDPLKYAGAAYVFERNLNGQWSQIQKIVSPYRTTSEFGASISVDGDYLLIGAPNEMVEDDGPTPRWNVGSVYIYKKNPFGRWEMEQRLRASDGKKSALFGHAHVKSGDFIAVGAYWETTDEEGQSPLKSAGAVYMFKKDESGEWNEVQKIVPSDRAVADFFGFSVDVKGNTMAIGAYRKAVGKDPQVGATYMYKCENDSIWIEVQKLEASDQGKMDSFGRNVIIVGDLVIICAPEDYDDVDGKNPILEAGSAYVFAQEECGVWK